MFPHGSHRLRVRATGTKPQPNPKPLQVVQRHVKGSKMKSRVSLMDVEKEKELREKMEEEKIKLTCVSCY